MVQVSDTSNFAGFHMGGHRHPLLFGGLQYMSMIPYQSHSMTTFMTVIKRKKAVVRVFENDNPVKKARFEQSPSGSCVRRMLGTG
jgi:hypothetical protein